MKKIIPLALLSFFLPILGQAATLATLQADLDGDSRPDQATLSTQDDDEYLLLEIRLASGRVFESRRLVRILRSASLEATPTGLLASTIEDQSSHAKSYDYQVAVEADNAELSAFDFHFSYPSGDGRCYVTPGSGVALFNEEATEFTPRTESLGNASGAWYESLCHELSIHRAK